MILVTISKGRKTRESEDYSIYAEEAIQFDTLEEAMGFVKDQYGRKRKVPVYIDSEDDRFTQVGYCINFRKNKESFRDWIVFGHLEYLEIAQANKYDIPLSTRH